MNLHWPANTVLYLTKIFPDCPNCQIGYHGVKKESAKFHGLNRKHLLIAGYVNIVFHVKIIFRYHLLKLIN